MGAGPPPSLEDLFFACDLQSSRVLPIAELDAMLAVVNRYRLVTHQWLAIKVAATQGGLRPFSDGGLAVAASPLFGPSRSPFVFNRASLAHHIHGKSDFEKLVACFFIDIGREDRRPASFPGPEGEHFRSSLRMEAISHEVLVVWIAYCHAPRPPISCSLRAQNTSTKNFLRSVTPWGGGSFWSPWQSAHCCFFFCHIHG